MKNITKLVICTAFLAILTFSLAACESKKTTETEPTTNNEAVFNYEAFVIGHSDSASGTTYQIEKNIKETKEKIDTTAPKTATLTIDGYTIEGTYSHSEMRFPDNFYRHVYYGEKKTHTFHLDDSGQLLLLTWPDMQATFSESEKVCTEEECLDIAKNFVLNNISSKINFADYTVMTNEVPYVDVYVFAFRKNISDCDTTDQVIVEIHKSGSLYGYSSFMFDRIPSDTAKFDSGKATQTVKEKLNSIYQDVKGKHDAVNYEEPEFYITILEDGKPAIYCVVTVRFENGKGGSISDLVSMIIT